MAPALSLLLREIRAQWRWVGLGVVLFGLSAAATAGLAAAFGPMVSSLHSATIARPSTDEGAAFSDLVIIVTGLLAARAVLGYAGAMVMARAQQRVIREMRLWAFAHVLRLSPAVWPEIPPAELAVRATQEIAGLRVLVQLGLAHTLRGLLMATALATLAFQLDTRLATLAILTIPILGLATWFIARGNRRAVPAAQHAEAALTALSSEQADGAAVIRAHRAEDYAFAQLAMASEDAEDAAMRAAAAQARTSPALEILVATAAGGIAVTAGPAGLALPIPTAVSLFAALVLMFRPLQSIAASLPGLFGGLGTLDRLDDLLDLPTAPEPPDSPTSLEEGVRLTRVRFAYRRDERGPIDVLRGIDLEVRAGERVAVIGPSGSGKTTLLMVLAGLLSPREGQRTIDGEPVTGVPPVVRWVGQEPLLFADSLLHNIAFAAPEPSAARADACARRVGLGPLLDRLPEGIDTWLGERGARLSAGERQRVAIARALYDAPDGGALLLLDEPTSALDPETEADVLAVLRALDGVTWVMATHREAAMDAADRVVRMRDGALDPPPEPTAA